MHLQHIRATAKRHDYDSYLCSLTAPMQMRVALWALLALDYELARIPQVTQEEMIRMIRLTWWREAIEEIYAYKPLRKHETVLPLAEAIKQCAMDEACLMQLWEARQNWVLEEQGDEACFIALWRCIAAVIGESFEGIEPLVETYILQRTLRISPEQHPYAEATKLLDTKLNALTSVRKRSKVVRTLHMLAKHYQQKLNEGPHGPSAYPLLRPALRSYGGLVYIALQKN